MSTQTTYSDLFKGEIEAFLNRHDITPTALGKSAAGDPNFVAQVRNGRSPTLDKADRVRKWMSAYKPQAAE